MSPTARLRRARPGDAAALLALEQHFPGDRMSPRTVRNLLASPSVLLWIAELSGTVVGALVLLMRRGSRVARIYSLVVDPRARGHGLGGRLVRRAQAAARAHGCTAVSLEVRADNTAARQLYAGLGYSVHAILPRYYEDGAEGLRLRKLL